MVNKFKITLFAAIFAGTLLYNCQAQNTQDKNDINNIKMEQKVIHAPQGNPDGFFTDKTRIIDRIEINYYQKMVSKKARIKKTITQSGIITELMQALLELPAKGDIYMKMAPTSSLYCVQFFSGQTRVGEAKIYNNSLQMSNTAFLSKANEQEDFFVNKIIEIINQ